jgi:hypothetical protein
MPYAAITFRLRKGSEDAVAQLFTEFEGFNDPIVRDEQGNEVAKLVGTAVFLKDDTLVRVIHYQGDFSAIPRHVARQPAIHEFEQRIQPYLAEKRETTPAAFGKFFRNASMRVVYQTSLDDFTATA